MTNRPPMIAPPAGDTGSPAPFRRWLYPSVLLLVVAGWTLFMTIGGHWGLFRSLWPMSLTMVLGSFVAGSTPAGGAAVAFPVFTKLLDVPTSDARTFGLLIQSVGMTMASLFIVSRGIRIYRQFLWWALPAGTLGLIVGTFHLHPPDPVPRLVFTSVAVVFGFALTLSHWWMRWAPEEDRDFPISIGHGGGLVAGAGFLGGMLASMVGSGLDILMFMVMTLAFGLHERRAIPTSVIAMATLSVVAVMIRLLLLEDGLPTPVRQYWLVCVPVVSLGAPFGAFVASRVSRDWLVLGLLALIVLDFASTVWIVELSLPAVTLAVVTGLAAAAAFGAMLRHRSARWR